MCSEDVSEEDAIDVGYGGDGAGFDGVICKKGFGGNVCEYGGGVNGKA